MDQDNFLRNSSHRSIQRYFILSIFSMSSHGNAAEKLMHIKNEQMNIRRISAHQFNKFLLRIYFFLRAGYDIVSLISLYFWLSGDHATKFLLKKKRKGYMPLTMSWILPLRVNYTDKCVFLKVYHLTLEIPPLLRSVNSSQSFKYFVPFFFFPKKLVGRVILVRPHISTGREIVENQ